jgi:hypothetical protein
MIERKIIIGLITSTEYLTEIKSIWDISFIESVMAKRVSEWCWEYYNKYQKAPSKNIEGIYFQKLKEGKLPKDLFSEIEEEILPGLSAEYENESFNLAYLIEETEKYFIERHLLLHSEKVQALAGAGQLEEAETLMKEYLPLDRTSKTFDNHILTTYAIREKEKPKTITLLSPWLKEGQTTIIYANYGVGKSLLTISIAYILGLKDYTIKEAEIGKWQVKHPTGCLYIDGELGEQEMEERVSQFEWIGKQHAKHKMKIFSIPEYQLATEDSFYLSERKNQLKIIQWLKINSTYKLVVLDSASTLFGLVEENDNSEWNNKVNPFLRDLRALNVACILLHHAGKNAKKGLRGASSMGAMAHNILRLSNHPSKNTEEGEAWFVIGKDKQRASGFSFKDFGLHFTQNTDQSETTWEVTNAFD